MYEHMNNLWGDDGATKTTRNALPIRGLLQDEHENTMNTQ